MGVAAVKWVKQHWRGVSYVCATFLFVVSGVAGYWWFYKLAPARRTLDPQWYAAHSQQEYWREIQKSIHRGLWFHDDGFVVGAYGGKAWAEWIMAHVRPGTSMGCFGDGPYHSSSSMRLITNQDAGEAADAWLAWWQLNKSKSQIEWIADGFRQRGIKVEAPPTHEQISQLLAILGDTGTNKPDAFPKEMKYNAFRWLRDSGFEPVAYALSKRSITLETERGLLEYARQVTRHPSINGLGILPFTPPATDTECDPLPTLLTPGFQIKAYVLMIGPLLLGVALLACVARKAGAK